jgi:beta-galactosidase
MVHRASPQLGSLASTVTTVVEATVVNWQTTSASAVVHVTVLDQSSTIVASVTSAATPVPPGGSAVVSQTTVLNNAELWSVPRPYLYTIVFTILLDGVAVDNQSVTTGFRKVVFDADRGMFVNDQAVKVCQLCHVYCCTLSILTTACHIIS